MRYIVVAGDTLSKIARDVVGDMNRWPEIAARNQLASPYTIRVGQVLDLPDPGAPSPGPVLPATPPPPMVPAVTSSGGGVPIGGAWWASPWLWLAGGAAVWWALRGRKPAGRRRRKGARRSRTRRPC